MLLIVGIVLVTFSIQMHNDTENTLDRWDSLGTSALLPQNPGPSWTLEVAAGSFFRLDISATSPVRIRIGMPSYDQLTGETVFMNPIFDQVGARFTQKVEVNENNTYEVQIKNEGAIPLAVEGNVSLAEIMTKYQTIYPYQSLGTPVALIGSILLIYGGFASADKQRYRAKLRER